MTKLITTLFTFLFAFGAVAQHIERMSQAQVQEKIEVGLDLSERFERLLNSYNSLADRCEDVAPRSVSAYSRAVTPIRRVLERQGPLSDELTLSDLFERVRVFRDHIGVAYEKIVVIERYCLKTNPTSHQSSIDAHEDFLRRSELEDLRREIDDLRSQMH